MANLLSAGLQSRAITSGLNREWLAMTFEQQILKLCEGVIACESEEKAIQLAREMQKLMHRRIEELRGRLITMQPIGPSDVDEKIA